MGYTEKGFGILPTATPKPLTGKMAADGFGQIVKKDGKWIAMT
jgi:hypothetical protein